MEYGRNGQNGLSVHDRVEEDSPGAIGHVLDLSMKENPVKE